LHRHWTDITKRGSFDLWQVFAGKSPSAAVNVHLHFVMRLGHQLQTDGIGVDLNSFSSALLTGTAHPEVTLLVASTQVPTGRFVSHTAGVSVLRGGNDVHSALWTHLVHPIAIKVCYLRTGAPVRAPEGHPWHPLRQRKIVKLSPYKGDTQPLIARRDLRI
jgi:hypothetical protein